MAERYRETERKYDVDEAFELPVLAGSDPVVGDHGPVEELLDATYYDTADHRLAAARTTLRRRTGGVDAGWHLKLPVSDGTRDEVRVPLDGEGAALPPELASLSRGVTRGREVAPVVRLRTARSVYRLTGTDPSGAEVTLAEVSDDRVVAQGMSLGLEILAWREVEVELVDGDAEVLDVVERLLRRAGAVPSASASKLARALGRLPSAAPSGRPPGRRSPAAEVVGAYLREQVEYLTAQDPRVRLDEPDSIHQMRVASRQLRSVLGAYHPLFDREVTDPIRAELKWLAGVLGEARDAEVMHERLRALVAAEPDDLVLGPVVARIDGELSSRYRDAHAEVIATLDGERYLALLGALDALLTAPPLTDVAAGRAADVIPRRVRTTWRRVRDAASAADTAPPERRDEALHEVRKAAKRARYASEAVRSVFGADAKDFGRQMKAVQSVLGDQHDSVVTRAELRAMASRAFLAGENGFTFGRMHAREQELGSALTEAYGGVWSEAAAKRLRRWLR
jgi:CHAD domain-containing protein